MKKYFLTTIFIILAGLVLTVVAVDAGLGEAADKFKEVAGPGGAGAQVVGEEPEDIIGIGIGAAITLVGMIFLALMVYAGYLWMTARGEEAKVEEAQKIITAALIGFFIVASAYAITKFVSGKLGQSSGGGGGGGGGGDEGGGGTAKGCCVTCADSSWNAVYFGDKATYVMKTQNDCLDDVSQEDEIYAEWFPETAAVECNGDSVAKNVKDSCDPACKNFESSGKCNYD